MTHVQRADPIGNHECWGWPVCADDRTGQPVATAGQGLDAITMPTAFGELVLRNLDLAMLRGPVVATRGRARLTFLTRPTSADDHEVPTELVPFGVRPVVTGGPVLLPADANPGCADPCDGACWWRVPPSHGRPLIIWAAVIGSARRVAARCAPNWNLLDLRCA